jgi:putative radical SAM enzyme (TIGR03279 family)
MTRKKHLIHAVGVDSIAKELGIEAGDWLMSIDRSPVLDIFDYRMRTAVSGLLLDITKKNGEKIGFDIEKDEYEELGLEFEDSLMDACKSCANRCVFCFIDQLPSGLRESLYFKDDDLRLSFLTGNYVTMTNLADDELDRLISYRFSPMNISVHTTDPALRILMLNNKNAGNILGRLRKITQAGIWVNCQIVLCPGINDGPALDLTLEDLFALGEQVQSIALVPVGLTRFRAENGAEVLRPFDQAGAIRIIETVLDRQRQMMDQRGERVLYAADEFYIKAGIPFPSAGDYGDFPQLENGVGMVPLFLREMQEGIRKRTAKAKKQSKPLREENKDTGNAAGETNNFNKDAPNVLLITGVDAKPYLEQFLPALSDLYGRRFHVKAIVNRFFGETVTVSGLVTGGDIISQLAEDTRMQDCVERVIMPACMLRSGEDVFLDDRSVSDVEKATGLKFTCADPTGEGLLQTLDECFPGVFKKKR